MTTTPTTAATEENPMRTTIALPTRDRPRSHVFLRDGLGLETPGDLAPDGVPEPLRATLSETCEVMMIPTGGFKWVTGQLGDEPMDAATLPPPEGPKQCLVTIGLGSRDDVEARYAAATAIGRAVLGPEAAPWGEYRAVVADPDGHLWQLTSP
ncbi:VOC family protein [Nocardioides luteus]|uniref:VOC family protein n=1 Tax=Nocardioides luteus TaxID=1844 RepID=UPI0018C97FF5|nr:VOC family protein [Nocardioides luteus]MBG6099009.1 putative lactoylglutathione lyase [Nocardioides luteus]